ncbi:unnamed protein product [Sphenostylis stenocarpa]|uniref:Uncharacterized protein n=1 Tax=Sphenostylis stenocarpa TaxID=92480 RepID=A0AA86V8L7_9FABA|nr:unnamed protein product [Sphenostylis stenocarpa]
MKCEALPVHGSSKRKEQHLRPNGEEIQLWHGQFRRQEKWREVEIKELGVAKLKGTDTNNEHHMIKCNGKSRQNLSAWYVECMSIFLIQEENGVREEKPTLDIAPRQVQLLPEVGYRNIASIIETMVALLPLHPLSDCFWPRELIQRTPLIETIHHHRVIFPRHKNNPHCITVSLLTPE